MSVLLVVASDNRLTCYQNWLQPCDGTEIVRMQRIAVDVLSKSVINSTTAHAVAARKAVDTLLSGKGSWLAWPCVFSLVQLSPANSALAVMVGTSLSVRKRRSTSPFSLQLMCGVLWCISSKLHTILKHVLQRNAIIHAHRLL